MTSVFLYYMQAKVTEAHKDKVMLKRNLKSLVVQVIKIPPSYQSIPLSSNCLKLDQIVCDSMSYLTLFNSSCHIGASIKLAYFYLHNFSEIIAFSSTSVAEADVDVLGNL